MLSGHGDDAYLFHKNIVANFSSNVYYKGMSAGLKAHLAANLHVINNYPEANAQSLQQHLAQWHGLGAGHIVITNGATEAFYLLARVFRNRTASILVPAFAEYEDACHIHHVSTTFMAWHELERCPEFQTDLAFLGNPNNPTGLAISGAVLQALLAKNRGTTFIVDEAYVDFTQVKASLAEVLHMHENLVIVKSLTKNFSIPGLRLGYLLAHPPLVNSILSCKMPWSVNALAIEAGKYIALHREKMRIPLEELLYDTAILINELRAIEGITVHPTQANYFLCQTEKGPAAALKTFLVNNYGVLIRDAGNFRSLDASHFRIATQEREKNKLLIEGIRSWIHSS